MLQGMQSHWRQESPDFGITLTPHSITGVPRWTCWSPSSPKMQQKQDAQRKNHDVHAKAQEFVAGDSVVKDFPTGKKWLTGVTEVRSPLSYFITLSDGRVVHCHVDHIKPIDSESGNHWKSQILRHQSPYWQQWRLRLKEHCPLYLQAQETSWNRSTPQVNSCSKPTWLPTLWLTTAWNLQTRREECSNRKRKCTYSWSQASSSLIFVSMLSTIFVFSPLFIVMFRGLFGHSVLIQVATIRNFWNL